MSAVHVHFKGPLDRATCFMSLPGNMVNSKGLVQKSVFAWEPLPYAKSSKFFMPPPFEECGRALSVAHVRASVRPSVSPFVHHYS